MKVTTNKANWTGEEATVEVTDRSFEYYDYTWIVGEYQEVFRGEGYVSLYGSDWGTEPVASLLVAASDELSDIVAAAVRWISNNV